jgi:GNAT superfamily N-acetyltransferase
MDTPRLDLSASAFPARIQENLIAYMRLFAGLPGMAMYDEADAFWFVCGRGAPGNCILRARWTEAECEARIDALIDAVGQHVEEIDWMIYPGDQPASLKPRLEARGLSWGMAGNWLWTDLGRLSAAPAVDAAFTIKPVQNDAMMAEWVRVSEAGFQGELGCFYDAYARHGYGPQAFSLHYTGYLGDVPVTSGTLLDAGGTAAVYDLSTPPQYRRQGFGGALTNYLLQEIRRRGYPSTWIWSSDTAHKLYQEHGFADADFGIREFGVKKKNGKDRQD